MNGKMHVWMDRNERHATGTQPINMTMVHQTIWPNTRSVIMSMPMYWLPSSPTINILDRFSLTIKMQQQTYHRNRIPRCCKDEDDHNHHLHLQSYLGYMQSKRDTLYWILHNLPLSTRIKATYGKIQPSMDQWVNGRHAIGTQPINITMVHQTPWPTTHQMCYHVYANALTNRKRLRPLLQRQLFVKLLSTSSRRNQEYPSIHMLHYGR